ncbi:MAG: PIN domain-containing protein, partial [Alcanivorax sediminis]
MEERAARLHTLSISHHASASQNDGTIEQEQKKTYVIDTNVLIHDPNSLMNFEEHRVVIPMTVLEELDKLKSGKSHTAADCRAAIRLIDKVLGHATPEQVEAGIPIPRGPDNSTQGTLTVLMSSLEDVKAPLPDHLNDNRIINDVVRMKAQAPDQRFILVTKDINMRLKARACGIESEDYHNDQLVTDI